MLGNMIISFITDFWTTGCTRCPDALHVLNNYAASPSVLSGESNIAVVSVCCGDTIDSSREILEDSDESPRWKNIHHYHMSHDEKESAKEIFGFKQVPFYIIVNAIGNVIYSGSKIDLSSVPSYVLREDNETMLNRHAKVGNHMEKAQSIPQPEERMFELDEDF